MSDTPATTYNVMFQGVAANNEDCSRIIASVSLLLKTLENRAKGSKVGRPSVLEKEAHQLEMYENITSASPGAYD